MQEEKADEYMLQELEEKIKTKEQELEEIMAEVDKEQAQIDDLTNENIQLKLNHSQIVSRLAASKLVNHTININTIPRPEEQNIKIDRTIFNEEHKDLLNEMENKTALARKKLDEQTNINDNLEAGINELIEKNSVLETETESFKMKTTNMIREKKALRDQIEMNKKKIRQINTEIQKVNQDIHEKDQEYIKLTEKHQDFIRLSEIQPLEKLKFDQPLLKEKATIESQILKITNSIEQLNIDKAKLMEGDQKATEDTAEQKTIIEQKIGWTQEKKTILSELESVKKEYDQIRAENNKTTSKISKLNTRYHRLKTLNRKWTSDDLDNLTYDEELYKKLSIDQLLDRATKEEVAPQKQEIKYTDRASVEFLESQVSQLQHELERSMVSLRATCQLTKEQISQKRGSSFDVESVYVNKIYDAQLKAATKNKNK